MNLLGQIMKDTGFSQYGVVDTGDIRFLQEIRKMCEVNTCQQYGKTWACPPAVGTVEECRQRVQQYEKLLVFNRKYDLEDSFDFEGRMAGAEHFAELCRKLDKQIKGYWEEYFILGNEGCRLCEQCTYPDAPCRFPDQAHGSLEGYGIFVTELANQAHIKYNNGPNTVTYFGGIACSGKDLERLIQGEA